MSMELFGLSPDGVLYQKILVIRINHSNAGFFAYVTFVLNQLIYAEKNNLLPVVYFGEDSNDGTNAFYDKNVGENTWDYYFEPVAGYTFQEIVDFINDKSCSVCRTDLEFLTAEELWYLHLEEPDSIYNYPYGIHQHRDEYDPAWYMDQRDRANSLIKKYISIKSSILHEINEFVSNQFTAANVLGLHLRGTDKGTAGSSAQLMRVIPPKEYFPEIDKYLSDHPDCQIFVASDQAQFIDQIRARYGNRVLALEATRMTGSVNAFQTSDHKNYTKGREVLLDCLLLSKCDYLIRCTSAVGEYATYFNRSLPSLDLNHHGKKSSIKANLLVAFARARHEFEHSWKSIKASKKTELKRRLQLFIGYNPFATYLWNELESRRYSKGLVWWLPVTLKDYLWAISTGKLELFEYINHRTRIRKKRVGCQTFSAAASRELKYLEIRTDSSIGTDFFHQFILVINQLHFADAHKLLPVVTLDHPYHPNYDPLFGQNVWGYYFDPVAEMSSEDLDASDLSEICVLTPHQQQQLNIADTSPCIDQFFNNAIHHERQLQRGRHLVYKYVKPNAALQKKIDRKAQEILGSSSVVGVQYCKTPHAQKSAVGKYAKKIDKLLTSNPKLKILVITDCQKFKQKIIELYGNRVINLDDKRAEMPMAPEDSVVNSPFIEGEQALIDVLLLSACNHLILGNSSASHVASLFKGGQSLT